MFTFRTLFIGFAIGAAVVFAQNYNKKKNSLKGHDHDRN